MATWDRLEEEAAHEGLHGFNGQVVLVDVVAIFGQARALDSLGELPDFFQLDLSFSRVKTWTLKVKLTVADVLACLVLCARGEAGASRSVGLIRVGLG